MKCSQCLTGEVVAAKKVNNVFYVLCEECEMKILEQTKETRDENRQTNSPEIETK